MRKIIFILALLVGTSVFGVYGQTKNEDIVKLLMVSGSDKLADQIMALIIPQFKQLIPEIPDAFWSKFKEKLNVKDLILACVPAYSKYYTHDEIKQLIRFYESPLGKRMVEVTPLLTQETMTIGQQWGEKIAQDIINELVKEGYLEL